MCYRDRNGLKFGMNKDQNLYFKLQKKSLDLDKRRESYDVTNIDSGHVATVKCPGLKTSLGLTSR